MKKQSIDYSSIEGHCLVCFLPIYYALILINLIKGK